MDPPGTLCPSRPHSVEALCAALYLLQNDMVRATDLPFSPLPFRT